MREYIGHLFAGKPAPTIDFAVVGALYRCDKIIPTTGEQSRSSLCPVGAGLPANKPALIRKYLPRLHLLDRHVGAG